MSVAATPLQNLRAPKFLALGLSIVFVSGVFLPAGSLFQDADHYLSLHMALEFIAMAVSVMIFALGWNVRDKPDSGQLPLMAGAFLAVALVDLLHVLSYSGMPSLVTPSSPEKAINFWLAGRFIASCTLLFLALTRGYRWAEKYIGLGVWGGVICAIIVGYVGLFHADSLPATFIPGEGLTPFKIGAEYVLVAMSWIAAGVFVRQASGEQADIYAWLAVAAWTLGLSELFFTLYQNVSDLMNMLGHVFKAIGYLMIYRALYVAGVRIPYVRLAMTRQQLQATLEAVPDLVMEIDATGKILACHTPASSVDGVNGHRLVGRRIGEFLSPDASARVQQALIETHIYGLVRGLKIPFMLNGPRWMELSFARKQGSADAASTLVTLARDITEMKEAEDQLRIAATAFESQEGLVVMQADGTILRSNQAFSRITGYSSEDIAGRHLESFFDDKQAREVYTDLWSRLTSSGSWEGEIWNHKANDEPFAVWATFSRVDGEDGKVSHYVGSFEDITQHKRAMKQIHELAFFDPLTSLPNRRQMTDLLGRALSHSLREQRWGCVLLLDIDNFKTINDTYGHELGDRLLVEVAHRLLGLVDGDQSIIRAGGDEFILVLQNLADSEADAIASLQPFIDQLKVSLAQPYHLDDANSLPYGAAVSVGAALFLGDAVSSGDLLKRSEVAMYKAKECGRNSWRIFDPSMQAALEERASLEVELRKAIPGNQLRLFFQAHVDDKGEILGAEGLVRWQHPERGLILPAEFIPIAEQSNLISALGSWVLETAVAQLHAWQSEAHTAALRLSINVSASQFAQDEFVTQVLELVQRYAIDPSKLMLELTESLVLENVGESVSKMQQLKSHGITISIDDFGTGYSSLNYLKRLPLDQLKIDQSFVAALGSGTNDELIVQSIIALAHAFKLEVIAEGVESDAQRRYLEGSGCLLYQGYLFGEPCPISDFEQRVLKNGHARQDNHKAPRPQDGGECL